MLQNIQTYIQSFANYLLAIIRKESVNSDVANLAAAVSNEFKKYDINLSAEESLIFLLAYIPHIYPNFYDEIIREAIPQGGDFPEFGGVRGTNHRGLLPTGETAQFILAGDGIANRIAVQHLLTDGTLIKQGILYIETIKEGEPLMSGRIIIDQEWVNRLVTGTEAPPKFSPDFPGKKDRYRHDLG